MEVTVRITFKHRQHNLSHLGLILFHTMSSYDERSWVLCPGTLMPPQSTNLRQRRIRGMEPIRAARLRLPYFRSGNCLRGRNFFMPILSVQTNFVFGFWG